MEQFQRANRIMHKKPSFHLISWGRGFVETLRKLCVSTKFRQNFGILYSGRLLANEDHQCSVALGNLE